MAGEPQRGSSSKAAASSPEASGRSLRQHQDEIPLEVDTELAGGFGDDGGSVFSSADSSVSETASVASSIYKFRVENGRTYHSYKAGKYFLPNDESENQRLDLQHNLFILTQDNRLFLAPIGKDKPPNRVLDVGCGTGIWAMDFADEFPKTAVVGVDLSPIQPSFVPPNVEFFVDDVDGEWNFANKFDFIYIRAMTGSIKDWPGLFKQAYDNLEPGGWIEVSDPVNPMICDDGTLLPDSAMLKWNKLMVEASRKLGSPLDSGLRYGQQLRDAGFVDVVKTSFKWPLGPWAKGEKFKSLGMWVFENIYPGLSGFSLMLFTNVVGMSVAEVETFLVDVRKDMENRSIHAYWPVLTYYAQKPL